MGQKIAKKLPKSPKWQKPAIGPRHHVSKPGKAGRSIVSSKQELCVNCANMNLFPCKIYKKNLEKDGFHVKSKGILKIIFTL